MLAQLEPQLPRDDRWAYEPKFDGFRGRLWRRGDASAQLFSRNGRDLAPWFPELTRAADILPRGTFLDGEIVIADEAGQADFGALQHRLTPAEIHQRRRHRASCHSAGVRRARTGRAGSGGIAVRRATPSAPEPAGRPAPVSATGGAYDRHSGRRRMVGHRRTRGCRRQTTRSSVRAWSRARLDQSEATTNRRMRCHRHHR